MSSVLNLTKINPVLVLANIDNFEKCKDRTSEKRYLDVNFELSKKASKSAAAPVLLERLSQYLRFSADPERATTVKTVLERLKTSSIIKSQLAGPLLAQIKNIQKELDAAQYENMFDLLTLLINSKRRMGSLFKWVEAAYPACLAYRFRREHMEMVASSGETSMYKFKNDPEFSGLSSALLSRPEGAAFLSEFCYIPPEGGRIKIIINQFSPEDARRLQAMSEKLPGLEKSCDLMSQFMEGNHAIIQLQHTQEEFDREFKILFPYINPSSQIAACPSLARFFEQFHAHMLYLKRHDRGDEILDRHYEIGMTRIYNDCVELVSHPESLSDIYNRAYTEYQALKTKMPHVLLSDHLSSDASAVPAEHSAFPTPREFESMRLAIDLDIPFARLGPEIPTAEDLSKTKKTETTKKEAKESKKKKDDSKESVEVSSRSFSGKKKANNPSSSSNTRTLPAAAPSLLAVTSSNSSSPASSSPAASPSLPTVASSSRSSHASSSPAPTLVPDPFANRAAPLNIEYDHHVMRWLSEAPAVQAQIKLEYASRSDRKLEEMRWRHTLGLGMVEQFIDTLYSYGGIWNKARNRISYSIPAQIELAEGTKYNGLYQLTFSPNAREEDGLTLFHYYFAPQSDDDYINSLVSDEMSWEDFPSLESPVPTARAKTIRVERPGKVPYTINPLTHMVTLSSQGANIHLYKRRNKTTATARSFLARPWEVQS